MTAKKKTRINEWFVPKFGPPKFRAFVGLLFLPYTGMCISFAVIGSLFANSIAWDRVCAIALIYALGLGLAAHAADSIGSKKVKPWGNYFTKRQLMILMATSLVAAYTIGIYYMVFFAPLLAIIAVLEGFFLLAYNFELFGGRFHNNFWFAVSWGSLPAMAGYVMQTNSVVVLTFGVAFATGLVSYLQIRISRPYKVMKQKDGGQEEAKILETGLKSISLGTIVFAISMLTFRILLS